jgi:hypothetical protein
VNEFSVLQKGKEWAELTRLIVSLVYIPVLLCSAIGAKAFGNIHGNRW